MRFFKIFPLTTIVISTLISLYLYPYLPDLLATHWGIDGSVNSYSPKIIALFISPVISIFLYILFLFLPKIPAYKKNWLEFDQYFYLFIVLIFSFLFYIYLLTMFWHLGLRFNMIQAMSPFLSIIFFYAGHLSIISRRNWFVGVRTPWSLQNDRVWQVTNQLAGNFLKLISLGCLFTLVIPDYFIWFIFIPLLMFVPIIFIYSFFLYQKYR